MINEFYYWSEFISQSDRVSCIVSVYHDNERYSISDLKDVSDIKTMLTKFNTTTIVQWKAQQ